MPLEIWNHLFHPFTYTAVNGDPQDFSPHEISRVKKIATGSIATGSIVLGTLEAASSSRSIKFSILTIGLTTLVIFYLATAVFKMLSGRNDNPTPSPRPVSPDPDQNKDVRIQPDQKEIGKTSAQASPIPANDGLLPLPRSPSNPATSSSKDSSIPDQEAISNEGGQSPPLVLSPQISPSDSATSSSIDTATPEKKVPSPAPLSPQLTPPSEPPQVNSGNGSGPKERKKKHPSSIASPQSSVQVPKQKSYRDLPLTAEEATKIGQIIKTVGNTMTAFLGIKKSELTVLGRAVQHVHPLKFLETVLNNSELKQCMISIKGSDSKWEGFLKGELSGVLGLFGGAKEVMGFEEKCKKENDQQNFAIYIADFCTAVNAPVDKVRAFVKEKEWPELVSFLINLK